MNKIHGIGKQMSNKAEKWEFQKRTKNKSKRSEPYKMR